MPGKIQVTPTQIELELKLGCDNSLFMFNGLWGLPENMANSVLFGIFMQEPENIL